MSQINVEIQRPKDHATDKSVSSPFNLADLYAGALPDVSGKGSSHPLPPFLDLSANPYESTPSDQTKKLPSGEATSKTEASGETAQTGSTHSPLDPAGDMPTTHLTPLKKDPGGDLPPTDHDSFAKQHPWRAKVLDEDKHLTDEINKDAKSLGKNEQELKQKAADIRQQEQTDASKNNGHLTSAEYKQLLGEEGSLQKQITKDDQTGTGTGHGHSKNPISDNGKVINGAYPGRDSSASFKQLEQELKDAGAKGGLHEQNMYLNVKAGESNQQQQEQLSETMATIKADVKAGVVPTLSLRMGSYPDISSGKDDAYLKELAGDLKSAGGKVVLRFDWEMNCKKHYSSGTPDEFKAAWQHTYDLFQNQGAKNVLFDYCPTGKAFDENDGALAKEFYPGNQYVNMIGCDAYDGIGGSKATTPDALFNSAYQFAQEHGKPFMIGETGAASSLGANVDAEYVKQMAQWMESHPNAVGISWFSSDTGVGGKFALDDSKEELEAYIKYFVDNPYFGGEGN